jgi:hypothetical protein
MWAEGTRSSAVTDAPILSVEDWFPCHRRRRSKRNEEETGHFPTSIPQARETQATITSKALATSHQAVGRLLPSICFSCFLRRHHPQSLVVFRLGLFTLIPGTTQFTLVMRGVGCPPRAMLLGQGSFPRHLATTGTPQQAPDASQSSQLCSRAYIQHWLRCRPLAQ